MPLKSFRSLSLIHPWLLTEIVPSTRKMVLSDWQLRATIIISLLCQIFLILLGNRRKYKAKVWIKNTLWVAYNIANWAATFSLSAISNRFAYSKEDRTYAIMAFWASFLLLHLGGPDTITALSLEDNELWQRHTLDLFVHLFLTCQIIYRSWIHDPLNILAIFILFVGATKYAERTWILWSASSDQFRNSMLHDPDPGPSYAKFMDEYSSKQAEGYEVSFELLIEETTDVKFILDAPKNKIIQNAPILNAAYHFFFNSKPLFADLILSFQDRKNSQSFFQGLTWKEGFDVIGYELGFMFDTLYTKAVVIYTYTGIFLRFINLFLTVSIFVAFWVVDKQTKFPPDKGITYFLIGGVIIIEFYAIIALLSSDWSMLWFSRHKNFFVDMIYKAITRFKSCFQRLHLMPADDKWSNSLAGYNLINFCLIRRPAKRSKMYFRSACSLERLLVILLDVLIFCIEHRHSNRYTNLEVIQDDLKKLIFEDLKKKSKDVPPEPSDMMEQCKKLCAQRGDQVLQGRCFDKIRWSVKVEFDQSILLWHIATDLCHHFDMHEDPQFFESWKCRVSIALADYMLHLLVECPFMLPSGIGKIRYQDTCAEAMEFFQERKFYLDGEKAGDKDVKLRACTALLKVNTNIKPSDVKGDRSKSVLFDACRLAKSLQSIRPHETGGKQKWDIIFHVWVEMLSYAANQCEVGHHAKQLRLGGELLTHVWLLMTQMGISEKFQMAESHERVKLVVS